MSNSNQGRVRAAVTVVPLTSAILHSKTCRERPQAKVLFFVRNETFETQYPLEIIKNLSRFQSWNTTSKALIKPQT